MKLFRWQSNKDEELNAEIQHHLDEAVRDRLVRGEAPDDARANALREFGNVGLVKEVTRATWGWAWLETLGQDMRYGARMLRKHPGFTWMAVLTLALGIGANTTMFSVVNAVLLNPLPFNEPERLVMVWARATEAAGGDHTPLAVADLFDLRAQSQTLAQVEAFTPMMFSYTGGELPEQVQAGAVSANFFSLFGVQPLHGRGFSAAEEQPGAARVVMLGAGFWRKHFAADPQVVGRAITLSGQSYHVIGVLPAKLDFLAKPDVWVAQPLPPPTRRGPHFLMGVARLKPDVTFAQARAEATNSLTSSFSGALSFNLEPVNEALVGDVRLPLLLLLGTVTLVTLIAVVNVANLMLVRAAARGKEMSIRAALGAGRWRMLRQLLTESLLLALIGGLLGLLLASAGIGLLLKLAPDNLPRLDQVRLDGRMLGWTALLSLLTSVLFGLAPAWQSSRLSPHTALKENGRGLTDSRAKRRGRDLLVVVELALAVTLLIGAGLLGKSFWRLQGVNAGVSTERVLTMQLALSGPRYAERGKMDAFHASLLERVQALPGVSAAAVSNSLPPNRRGLSDLIHIEGRTPDPQQTPTVAGVIRASQDYFDVLGIPLRGGRGFTSADSAAAAPVALISETTARQFFPNENPLGKRVRIHSEGPTAWREIVGVVADVKYNGLADKTQPALYEPLAQAATPFGYLLVKTALADPLSLTSAVRIEIKALDRELPVTMVQTLEENFALAVARPRFQATLLALFAALALLLASVGIYGVISYSVAQRTHEMGVRLALGARARDVLLLVLKHGLALIALGVALGLTASFALARWLKTLLFGVSASDVTTFVLIPLLLAGVALIACWIPARRAAKVDPLIALRDE